MLRRPFLAAAGALLLPGAHAQRKPGTGGPLRLGVDRSLADSGLAPGLQRAFSADTGIAVKLVPGPALAVLDAVTNGEVDAALLNAPEAEGRIAQQNLVHDRRLIAHGEFVLVGPAPRTRGRAAARGQSGAEALLRIREQATAATPAAPFLSAGDGSGVHVAEQALWRAARVEPVAPWYVTAEPGRSFIGQVRERGAYALVERGAWATLGGAPLAIVVDGDPTLAEAVHAMRSFRVSHPAGKIFLGWIGGGRGRAVVGSVRGYRAPAA
ncbi:MAG TPA: substrate-binding domain-containing protein [Caldimonas sp.]|jgi:tungstate transport system substrate-binding protein|nr:substrate-binding domain-containing protein [Caldimonas sp.]HEX2540670.1 substrate-binding domain-containing protein [Caldimonas sp.]